MSPGFSESMRKLHEPCGARLVADVAHALLRAVSRLISTPALLFDTVCESCARTGRREESRRGTHECVRYVGDHLPHSASSSFLDIRRSEPLVATFGGFVRLEFEVGHERLEDDLFVSRRKTIRDAFHQPGATTFSTKCAGSRK